MTNVLSVAARLYPFIVPLGYGDHKKCADEQAYSAWESTKTQYLIRYRASGVNFAKFKAGGKQFRFSLHTAVRSVAEIRLDDERRKRVVLVAKPTTSRLTVGDVIALYRAQFQADNDLKPGTKGYKEEDTGFQAARE